MIEVKNQFARHTMFWWIFAPFLMAVILPFIIPKVHLSLNQAELEAFNSMGIDGEKKVKQTDSLFDSWFIQTKIRSQFDNIFENTVKTPSTWQFQQSSRKVTSEWNDGFWSLIYRAMWRINALMTIYLMGFICFIIPSFIDGLISRAKKKYEFRTNNPLYFYSSAHTTILIAGLALFIPFIPYSLTALTVGLFIIILAGSSWIVASNFQTGL